MSDDPTTILTSIHAGEHDDHLDAISHALRARKDALGSLRAASLRAGQTAVIVGDDIGPAYLHGLEVTIDKVNRTRAAVRFNDPARAGRFAHGVVRVPIKNLEPVASPA